MTQLNLNAKYVRHTCWASDHHSSTDISLVEVLTYHNHLWLGYSGIDSTYQLYPTILSITSCLQWSSGWWYTYPSEKSWSSSVGMMKFPTFYGKSNQIPWFQSPPIRILSMVSSLIYPLKAWWVSFPSVFSTMWGPPVISWSINPSNYSYKYYKP